jgi:hypothetical protein
VPAESWLSLYGAGGNSRPMLAGRQGGNLLILLHSSLQRLDSAPPELGRQGRLTPHSGQARGLLQPGE